MKKNYLIGSVLLMTLSGFLLSCEKKGGVKATHFGSSPEDGDNQSLQNVEEESFGPSSGDEYVEEHIHFGPDPIDG